jgi:hypothetical protein
MYGPCSASAAGQPFNCRGPQWMMAAKPVIRPQAGLVLLSKIIFCVTEVQFLAQRLRRQWRRAD